MLIDWSQAKRITSAEGLPGAPVPAAASPLPAARSAGPIDWSQAKPAKPVADPGVVLPSIKRAGGQMVESLGTTIEDITGPNAVTRGLQDFGGGVVQNNPSQINSVGDILDKPWTTVKEAVAEQIPQLGAAYAGAAGGAALGSLLGPAGAAVGGVIGGLAPIAVQEYGEIRGKQKETGEENIPLAIAGAGAATALERLGLEKLATKAGAKGLGEVLDAVPEGASRLAHAGKEALKTAAIEGPGTEIPQTAIERFAGGQDVGSPDAFEEYGMAGVKGAVGGGAIGGGLGLVAPRETTLPAPAITDAEPQGDAGATRGAGGPRPSPTPSEGGGWAGVSPGAQAAPDIGLADLDPEQRRHMTDIRGPLTAAAAASGLPSSTPASATATGAGRRPVMTSDATAGSPSPLPSRRSRDSLSPLGAQEAERARVEIAAEQVRTAELARSGPLGRAAALGAESGSLPGAVSFAAPPSMATAKNQPPGASTVAQDLPATPAASVPAPNDTNARAPHGLNVPRTEAAALKLVTDLGARFPDERFEVVPHPKAPKRFAVRPVAAAASVLPTPTEGSSNESERLSPPRQAPQAEGRGRDGALQDAAGPGQGPDGRGQGQAEAQAVQPLVLAKSLDQAAHQAATSPHNDLREPTVPQKDAGNYQKGHLRYGGLDISIESPKDSKRSGTDLNGKPWEVEMSAHYGYIRRTEGKDGEQVDVYIASDRENNPDIASDRENNPVFVVDQVDPKTNRFDEHKVVLGAASRVEALATYDAHFSDGSGPARRKDTTGMSMDGFKAWLKDGDTKKPIAKQKLASATAATPAASNTPTDTPPPPAGASPGPSQEVGLPARTPKPSLLEERRDDRRSAAVDDGTAKTGRTWGVLTNDKYRQFIPFPSEQEAQKFAKGTRNQVVFREAPVAKPRSATSPLQERREPSSRTSGDGAVAPTDTSENSLAERLRDPELRAALQYMATQAGWAQRGGELLRDAQDQVTGRTEWLPNEPWYAEIPERLGRAATIRAVKKAIDGNKLGGKEKRVLSYMLDAFESGREEGQKEVQSAVRRLEEDADRESREEREAIMDEAREALDALSDTDIEVLLGTRDWTPFDWQVRLRKDEQITRFFDQGTAQGSGAAEEAETRGDRQAPVRTGGEAGSGEQRPGERPILESYTADDLAEREQANLDAERRAEEQNAVALSKRQADRDREGFVLTGSDNVADEMEARGQAPLDLKGVTKPGEKTDTPTETPAPSPPSPSVDYEALNRMVRRQRAELTRAVNSKDPARVLAACRAAVIEWNKPGAMWPDNWSLWQRALDDALPFNERQYLEDLPKSPAPETPAPAGVSASGEGKAPKPKQAGKAVRDRPVVPARRDYLKHNKWVLEHEGRSTSLVASGGGMFAAPMKFASREDAEAYARKNGYTLPGEGSPVPPDLRGNLRDAAESPLRIEDLSEKTIIVLGDTKTHKDRIKALRGMWNPTRAGWVFPKKREAQVRAGLEDLLAAEPALGDAAARKTAGTEGATVTETRNFAGLKKLDKKLAGEVETSIYELLDRAPTKGELDREVEIASIGRDSYLLKGTPWTKRIHAAFENKAVPTPQAAAPATSSPAIALAHALRDRILEKPLERITAMQLFAMATKAYGGTAAQGKYVSKDAYDALELALNLARIKRPPINLDEENATRARQLIDSFEESQNRLPTPSKRSGEQVELQQFSTPHTHAHVMAWVAHLGPSDTVLEPSAGTGNIVTQALLYGPKAVHANEISERRAELVAALGVPVSRENAAHIDALLPGLEPTVVLMNPPFSANMLMKGKKATETGAEHVAAALRKLAPGGRLVALLGRGMGFTETGQPLPRFREWWAEVQKVYSVRAVYGISGREYRKFGTEFDTALVVIDKTGPTSAPIPHGSVEKVSDLPALLEGIRNDRREATTEAGIGPRSAGEQAAAEPGSQEGAGVAGDRETGARDAVRLPVDRVVPAGEEASGAQRRRGHAGRRGAGESSLEAREGNGVPRTEREQPRREAPAERRGDVPDGANGARDDLDLRAAGQDGGDRAGLSDEGLGRDAISRSVEDPSRSAQALDPAAVFEQYRPRIAIRGAKPHPAILAESAAMASVKAPESAYLPNLPKRIIDEGRLSDAQLVNVIQAGQSHGELLPNGTRRGYFIGDGTGVGKGAQIAGIILDNWNQGRKRAVWVSENGKLFNDAGRDIEWVGMEKGALHLHNKFKADIPLQEGVLFTTYDTLKGEVGGEKDTNPHPTLPRRTGEGREGVTEPLKRLVQIVKWLGEDFDGVIAFDEAHNLGNSLDEKGDRGVKKAASKAIAGVELQKRLPKARVLYVSATGATSVENLAYTDRLGLWGEGTAFANKRDFIDKIKAGGVATMEVVAKDMKAMGLYEARNLAFAGVVQRELLHSLTPDQTDTYNEIARAWQLVLDNVNAALKITGAEKNSRAKSNALSQFWGSQQRFFNQVLTSLSVPTLIRDAEAQLKAGRSVVMQLVNTNEAVQERRLAQAAEQGIDIGDIDINPRDVLMQYVGNAFPTQLYDKQLDENGNEISVAVQDSAGNPVEDPEAVRRKDALLEKLASLAVPEGVLEQVVNHFGTKEVAEITGRSRRVLRHKDGSTEIESLSPSKSNKDADAFMQGGKRILIFSDAGGTGRSYHADLKAKNQQKRIHYLVQPGWRADKAVQGLGRTHRTNQAHPPEYVLVTTNLKAQRRFMSSIARRLDQLGALTKGQRDTASQGLFSAEMNLENQYGQWALRSLMVDMLAGRVPGITKQTLEQEMGLYLTDPKTGAVQEQKMPTVPRFLNRMLALESETMDRVFDAFYERLEAGIDYARQQGTLDVGMETITAQSVEKLSDQVIAGGQGKAETRYVKLALTDPVRFVQFDQLPWSYHPEIARNRKSGKLYAFVEAPTLTDPKTGELVQRLRRLGVRDQKYLPKRELDGDAYEMLADLPRSELRAAWDAEIAKSPQTRTTEMHLVTGALLPIWDRLPTDTPKVLRTETDEGERLLGREIPPSDLSATLKALGAQGERPDLSPVQMARSIMEDGATLGLANGWKIGTRVVSGEERIEVIGPTGGDIQILKDQGAFAEIISFRNRVFIPTGSAAGIIERITTSKPVVEVLYPKGAAADSGVRYSYLGERGAKTPKLALAAAREFAAQGIPMEEIRKVTGWFRAKDEKWRFEVSDAAATLRPDHRKGTMIGEVLEHDTLFENYPSLRDIAIKWRTDFPNDVRGGFDSTNNVIHLNAKLRAGQVRSVLLHELQHAVQFIEGFAQGGSTKSEEFRSLVASMGLDPWNDEAILSVYRRLLGEVEARDVQARRSLTAEELRERPPYVSQGIPEADLIVRHQGETAADEGPPGDTPSGSPFVRGRAEQKPGPAGLSVSGCRETLTARFGGGVGRLIKAGTLRIVQHESEVPKHLNDGKGGIRAVYDSAGNSGQGKVWMVGDNLTSAEAPGVFLHDLGVHFGLERMIGSEKYKEIIRQLKAMSWASWERLGNKTLRAARAAIPNGTPKAAVDDELVAYLVEKHPELPIVKRIIAAIRAFLFRHGLIKNIRPEDVVALAKAAARHAGREAREARIPSISRVFPGYSPEAIRGLPLFARRQKMLGYDAWHQREYGSLPSGQTPESHFEAYQRYVAEAERPAVRKAQAAKGSLSPNATHVLSALQQTQTQHGYATFRRARALAPEISKADFDAAVLEMRERFGRYNAEREAIFSEHDSPLRAHSAEDAEHLVEDPKNKTRWGFQAVYSGMFLRALPKEFWGNPDIRYSRAEPGVQGRTAFGEVQDEPPPDLPRSEQGRGQEPPPDPNTPEGAAEQLGRIGEAMRTTRHGWDAIKSKMLEDWRPAWLGLFTRRQIVDIGQGMVPELANYDRAVQAMDADRNQFDDEAHDAAEVAAAFVRKDRKEADKLFDLMHAATLAGADPAERFRPSINRNEAYQEISSLRRRMRGRSGEADVLQAQIDQIQIRLDNEKVRKLAHPGLAKRYFGLTQDAKVVYAKMRDLYKKRFDEREDALIERIRDAEADERWKARLIADIKHRFETARLSAPYFPLTRFGDYWMSTTNPDGEREYHLRESAHQQRALIKELTKAGHHQIVHGFKMDKLFEQQGASAGFVTDVIKLLDKGMRNSPGAGEIKDAIYQMYLQSLPDLSARKHWIHREKVPGFSQDALRGFAKQMFHGNRQLARLRHQTAMEKALLAANKSVRDAPDPVRAAQLVNEMQKRDEWIKNPTTSTWANVAGSVGFLWYLTTPAAAAVNGTQTPLVAYPLLAARYGWGKSAMALKRAATDYFRGGFSVEGALQGEDLAAYQRFLADGLIDKTQSHDLAGMSETPSAIYSGRAAKVMRASSFLFHRVERMNREVTALAAFRLGRAQGLGVDAAYDQAKALTWEAHFDYSNSNKARFIQGDAARVLLMFKQFSQHMTYLLARSAQQSFKLFSPGLSPAARREARIRLTGMIGMHALFAGALGMPLMGTLSMVMNALFDDDEDEPWDFETELRNFLAEAFGPDVGQAIARGPVESLTGLGISSRVGLSDLWFREPDKSLEGRGLVEWWSEQLLGPLGGIALKAGTGYTMFQEGHTMRGLESMTPTAITSGLRMLRYASEGVQSLRGDPVMEDVSAWNLFTQAAGFSPAELGQKYDVNRAIKDLEQRILDRRERLINRWWLARRHGDTEGVQEAMAEIGKFNKSTNIRANPRARIMPATLLASMQSRRSYSRRAEAGIIVDRRLSRLPERVSFGG